MLIRNLDENFRSIYLGSSRAEHRSPDAARRHEPIDCLRPLRPLDAGVTNRGRHAAIKLKFAPAAFSAWLLGDEAAPAAVPQLWIFRGSSRGERERAKPLPSSEAAHRTALEP